MPRHPPNALTSLTTGTYCSLLRQSYGPVELETLRQMAKSSRSSSFAVPQRRLLRLISNFSLGSQCDVARSNFNKRRFLCDLLTFEQLTWMVRAAQSCMHFVQLFSFQMGQLIQLVVGQERLELSTPRLSSVCSNQLSYWPVRPSINRTSLSCS